MTKLYFTTGLSQFMSLIDMSETKECSTNDNVDYLLILGMIVRKNGGYKLTEYGSEWLSQRIQIPMYIMIENHKIIGVSTQLISEYNKEFPRDYDYDETDKYIMFKEPIPISI